MDWSYITDGTDRKTRFMALVYLLRERHELTAMEAGGLLQKECITNHECRAVIDDIRTALITNAPTEWDPWRTEVEARKYLADLLVAFDRQ